MGRRICGYGFNDLVSRCPRFEFISTAHLPLHPHPPPPTSHSSPHASVCRSNSTFRSSRKSSTSTDGCVHASPSVLPTLVLSNITSPRYLPSASLTKTNVHSTPNKHPLGEQGPEAAGAASMSEEKTEEGDSRLTSPQPTIGHTLSPYVRLLLATLLAQITDTNSPFYLSPPCAVLRVGVSTVEQHYSILNKRYTSANASSPFAFTHAPP